MALMSCADQDEFRSDLSLVKEACAPELILHTAKKRMNIGTFGWTTAQLSKFIPTLMGWTIQSPTSQVFAHQYHDG